MSMVLTGLKAWVLQRASAVYLLFFILFMPIVVIYQNIDGVAAWHDFIYSPIVTVTWILFFASLLMHAWVGIRDVLMDYIHSFRLRLLLLSMLAIYLLAMMLWVLQLLLLSIGVTV